MPYKTTDEIRVRMRELRAGIQQLAAVEGDLEDQQRSDWTEWNEEIDHLGSILNERTERAQRLSVVAGLNIDEPTQGEVTGGANGGQQVTRSTNGGDGGSGGTVTGVRSVTGDGATAAGINRDAHFQQGRNTSEDEVFDRSGMSVADDRSGQAWRDKAMRSIEMWERTLPDGYRESAEHLVADCERSRGSRAIAEHILKFGNPQYVRAFWQYLSQPERAKMDPEIQRAMAEGTSTSGGFMVPPFLDPAIILTNAGISNPFRAIATVKTITTETWKGVTSAGVTAEWTAEATEMSDASPQLGQPTITPVRADAYLQASFEMIEDTDIASELAMLFADARDRLEGAAFAVGTGSTQPTGIVTSIGATTTSQVTVTTTGQFGAVDVFAADNALPQRWRPNASWVGNKSIYNRVRQMATGSGALVGSFWVDFGGARPSSLIGYPVYEASAMDSVVTSTTASQSGILVVGDFRQFYIVDRIGMSVAYNPLVLGANRRPTGEVGWASFWRVGAKTVNPDAFRAVWG